MKHRLVCSLVIGLSYASAAAADPPPPTIKGTYAAVGSNTCLVAPGFSAGSPTNPTPGTPLPNSGFNSNFVPKDSASSFQTSLSDEGIWVFDGQGNGTHSDTNVDITPRPTPGPGGNYPAFAPSASSNSVTATFTYTVNSDGTWTYQGTPNGTQVTFLTGGRTGQTAYIDTVQMTGLIGAAGVVGNAQAPGLIGSPPSLTVASTTPYVETVFYSNGDVWPRVCYRHRVLIRMGN